MTPVAIKAILFDLDDTLYDEVDFYRSGFTAVGAHLEARGIGIRDEIVDLLLRFHVEDDRERVLQAAGRACPVSRDVGS
jgi:FMN phosphatase YigB (HAD superfamily)